MKWNPTYTTPVAAQVENKSPGKVPNTKKYSVQSSSILHDVQTIKDWKAAIISATDVEKPDYTGLAKLYQNLLLNAHTAASIESRLLRVQRSKFVLKNEKGEEIPEAKKLLERPWFEQFISHALGTKFTGFRVLELFHLNDQLELSKCGVIPIEHIDPIKQRINKEAGGTEGWQYNKGVLTNYYMFVGDTRELGLLADLAILILSKKMSMGSWLNLVERFGVPMVFAKTDSHSDKRVQELYDMLLAIKNNSVSVVNSNEEIELVESNRIDPHNVFNELIKRINSEISKRILGQDGTTDNKDASGTYGSLKVLQGVADDRHESDKLFIQYLINSELLPRLTSISSTYKPLENLTFDWDESEEMNNETFIKNVVDLTNAGYLIDYQAVAEKTGIPVSGMVQAAETEEIESKKKSL